MAKSIYVLSTEADSGKFIISLGLMSMLLNQKFKTAYFKPIAGQNKTGNTDSDIEVILDYFQLPCKNDDCSAITGSNGCAQMGTESNGEMLDEIIRKYKSIEAGNDFVVVQGTDYLDNINTFEPDVNLEIAKNLGSSVILVLNGEGKLIADIVNDAEAVLHKLNCNDIPVLAIIVNKMAQGLVAVIKDVLVNKFDKGLLINVIPEIKVLKNPTLEEVCKKIKGKILSGKENLLNPVSHTIIGATLVPQLLKQLKENSLIVTPVDRSDIITAVLLARLSPIYPPISGLILTEGNKPEKQVMELTKVSGLPVISSTSTTFDVAGEINSIHPRITITNPVKIASAINTFNKFIDKLRLKKAIRKIASPGITPHMFQYQLIQQAKKFKTKIVLPEAEDERILKAAARIISLRLADIILLGNPGKITSAVKKSDIPLDLNKLEIVDPAADTIFSDYANSLYQLRKDDGLTLESANALMRDLSYFGTMMVYKGRADAMVSGAVYTTRQTIKPALQFIKVKEGKTLISSVFFMCLPDRVVIFGDCAVNPDPTAEQLAEIAISSAETSLHFNIEPKIAMISYSSGTSGTGKDVEKVRQATQIVRYKRPELKIEGPIQYDAAVNPVTGRAKLPDSEVAGNATVLIFPDLNTGNAIYKAVQQETGAMAIGPVLQDLKKPVNDLSRGGTVDDIFNTILVTSIQCQQNQLNQDENKITEELIAAD
jgi:phosphate acetyltransferase